MLITHTRLLQQFQVHTPFTHAHHTHNTYQIYFSKFKSAQRAAANDDGGGGDVGGDVRARTRVLHAYRRKARALVSFVGLHQVVVGADVNYKLVRLEALMS
jgi:hypothetical protein